MSAADIQHYLATGDSDPIAAVWPGDGVLERCVTADRQLRAALIEEVQRRASVSADGVPAGFDPQAHSREVLRPMVEGLFRAEERAIVLELLVDSQVFVTADTIVEAVRSASFLSTAWSVANLYLRSVGAPELAPGAGAMLGLCAGSESYVGLDYFRTQRPFDDFLIHEAAHVFHGCRRHELGLAEKRGRTWLLPIDFHDQENFAYACEAYGWIARQTRVLAERTGLARQFAKTFSPGDPTVSRDKVCAVVQAAAGRRNGWRVILDHCSEKSTRHRKRLEPHAAPVQSRSDALASSL